MFGVTTFVSLFLLALSETAVSSPCVAFDTSDNLLAFGLNGKDYNAGAQGTWSNTAGATDITASGRPPFDGQNTTCYLAQYFNAIYFLNADASNPANIYIYDATAKSWSMQAVTAGTFQPNDFVTILDHDTNLFYALSHGELYALDMGQLKAASDSPLEWKDIEPSGIAASGYDPVMALAQNHIHFLNVPQLPAGQADIFVIHYSYWQPEAQSYPSADGKAAFPATHGRATSLFQATTNEVQQEFAFLPDDFSGTYIVNVESNTTQVLAAPTSKDKNSFYFGGVSAILQLDSSGAVYYLPYKQSDASANSAASWTMVKSLATSAPPAANPSGSGGNGSGSNTSGGPKGTPTGASADGSGALASAQMATWSVVALCAGVMALLSS